MWKKTINLIGLIFIIGFYGCTTGTGPGTEILELSGTFTETSLHGKEIYKLRNLGESIYAAADDNMYLKKEPALEWEPLGLSGWEVPAFVILSEQELIASVDSNHDDSLTIVRSIDGGKNWQAYQNAFWGEKGFRGNTQIIPTSMDNDRRNPSATFARFAPFLNVIRSTDGGESWESVMQTWDNPIYGTAWFVKVDSNHPQTIWAGGSSALFVAQLFVSRNGGEDWTGFLIDPEGVEGGSVYDVVTNPVNAEHIMIAGSSWGLGLSKDGGENWVNAYNERSRRIEVFAQSTRDSEIVYASGQNEQGTLFFAVSDDFGDSWQTVEFEDGPSGIRVNDMLSVLQNGREVLYFATSRGVYSYTFED